MLLSDLRRAGASSAGIVVAVALLACLLRSLSVQPHSRLIALLIPLMSLVVPTSTSAQWRYPPIYPGYPPYRYASPESSLRLNLTPKEASVYVDGYFAGRVEEFDGRFQRLRVLPGEHEIVIFLEGYRPLKQRLYLSPNATRAVDGAMERLAAGEAQEPAPVPSEDDRLEPADEAYSFPPARGRLPRRGGTDQPPPQHSTRTDPGQRSRYASLSIRVQPGGAVVLIDGERWDGPSHDERLIVQVEEGHHVIEVERDGYDRFTMEVDVRRGETTPVNISLRRR